MIRKICPTCDQVMTSAHYCHFCRKYVREPKVQEVGYFLNEQHGTNEEDCDYHGIHHGIAEPLQQPAENPIQTPMSSTRNPSMDVMDVMKTMFKTQSPAVTRQNSILASMGNRASGRKTSKPGQIIAILVFIIVLFNLIIPGVFAVIGAVISAILRGI